MPAVAGVYRLIYDPIMQVVDALGGLLPNGVTDAIIEQLLRQSLTQGRWAFANLGAALADECSSGFAPAMLEAMLTRVVAPVMARGGLMHGKHPVRSYPLPHRS